MCAIIQTGDYFVHCEVKQSEEYWLSERRQALECCGMTNIILYNCIIDFLSSYFWVLWGYLRFLLWVTFRFLLVMLCFFQVTLGCVMLLYATSFRWLGQNDCWYWWPTGRLFRGARLSKDFSNTLNGVEMWSECEQAYV